MCMSLYTWLVQNVSVWMESTCVCVFSCYVHVSRVCLVGALVCMCFVGMYLCLCSMSLLGTCVFMCLISSLCVSVFGRNGSCLWRVHVSVFVVDTYMCLEHV